MKSPSLHPNALHARDQYRDSKNLDARIRLHQQYSTNKTGWYSWYLDQVAWDSHVHSLEVGCGPASIWQEQGERLPQHASLTLTDFSPGMVRQARQNIADPRFQFAASDAMQLPFESEQFDAVFANHMLYHVPDVGQTIAELRRVLRPNGVLYAATNGLSHMVTLYELAEAFAPDVFTQLETIRPRRWIEPFSLENGEQLLRQSFSKVECRRYEDSLIVPEAQPLVDYIASMFPSGKLSATQHAMLYESLSAKIARQGAIHIAKSSGIFIAHP